MSTGSLNLSERAIFLENALTTELIQFVQEAQAFEGGYLCADGPGSWHNVAVGLGLNAPFSNASLDKLITFYKNRGVAPKVALCSYADESVLKMLADRGFRLLEIDNLWACDLRQPAATPAYSQATELTMLEVCEGDKLEDSFLELSSAGFTKPGEPISEKLESVIRKSLKMDICRCVLAVIDGVGVGSGQVSILGDVAILVGASVSPQYRGRGIQTALMRERMDFAKKSGCRFAVVSSTPGLATERNAMRLGFDLAYSRVVLELRS